MESLVLIFNPSKSKLEKDLVELLRQDNVLNYFCVHDFDFVKEFPEIKPNIIFFILDGCCSLLKNKNTEYYKSLFQLTPVIGVLNVDKSCLDCEFIRRIFWNFITSPIRKQDISLIMQLYYFNHDNQSQNVYSSLKKNMCALFLGESAVSLAIKEQILKVAEYDVTVLINGETGTGKELSAKMIHFLSDRSDNSFVPLNCGAVPSELFENELFGHKKGAYTNAESSEGGLIAEADKGTLFLDEIDSLPDAMQVKLLRFLEEKKYKPLGQSNYVSSNVRIIAAAKENLWDKVTKKQFREDLFYRLNILNISLPPLRERQQDIPILAANFINRFSKLYNKKIAGIESFAMMKLLHYGWEGNVRELQNLLEEAVIMNTTGWIEEENLNFRKKLNEKYITMTSFKSAKQNSVTNFEKSYLNDLLIAFNGNLTRAAKFARKDRRAFIRLIKKYNIDPVSFRNIVNSIL
jgi:two-component system response regulator GlrR